MRKISVKIIISIFIIFFITAIIPRFIIYMLRSLPAREIFESEVFLIGMALTAFLTLMLFAYAMNLILIKRLKKLNEATKQVASGNFDVHLVLEGKDEVSNLAEDFNKMIASLKANEYLNKEFVKNFSHELKTPISAIRGYAELISSGNLSVEEIEEYSKIIVNESTRLNSLSRSMLQLSQLDSTLAMKKEDSYNMAEQIRTVIQMMQLEWEANRIEFVLDLEEIKVVSNKEFTYQIWQNLIDNSIRYSKSDGKIEISLKKSGTDILFKITDYGYGISIEDQDRIFETFFVAEKSRYKQSSGVGLSITKKIVEKFGGTITFDSQIDDHTTFYVSIPEA